MTATIHISKQYLRVITQVHSCRDRLRRTDRKLPIQVQILFPAKKEKGCYLKMRTMVNRTNTKEFRSYQIQDITAQQEHGSYKTFRKRRRELVPFPYFSKNQFKNYAATSKHAQDPLVAGNIFIGQRHYEIFTDDTIAKEKRKRHIYGVVNIPCKSGYIRRHQYAPMKSYDMFEARNTTRSLFQKTLGYAAVGNNQFVRLCTHTFWPLLFLFFSILILCFGLSPLCGNSMPINSPEKEIGTSAGTMPTGASTIPANYSFPKFSDRTITAEQRYMKLYNPIINQTGVQFQVDQNGEIIKDENGKPISTLSNDSLWLAFELIEDGETLYKTNFIEPGKEITVDLYVLLPAGEHKITVITTSYSYQNQEYNTSNQDEFSVRIIK